MKALIIDNEVNMRKLIRAMLTSFCPDVVLIEEATGVTNGVEMIHAYQPDLVLLDVEMDDGTGFDLMQKVTNPAFQLIFITAHNKYAIDAFGFSAIDFLLKPVNPELLQRAVQKAKEQIKNKGLGLQIEFLLKQITNKTEASNKIVLKDAEKVYFIKVADIVYCEAERTYTKFYFVDSKPILVSKNLKEYEDILEPLGFIRAHHSYLVNPEMVKVFEKTDGGVLQLEGGYAIPVSQRKKEAVLAGLEGK